MLDVRLLSLAKKNKCVYSRYADDLTFSTNTTICSDVAFKSSDKWTVGRKLATEIKKAGFWINLSKVRMAQRNEKQSVTGLVVNQKVNVSQKYYRNARAMCNSMFQSGIYTFTDHTGVVSSNNLNKLEGILSYIYAVKDRTDRLPGQNKTLEKRGEFSRPRATTELYRRLLFFKYFAAPVMPMIYTEGISDVIYLRSAIQSLATKFPTLASKAGSSSLPLQFLKLTARSRYILKLGDGTSGQASLIRSYADVFRRFGYKPMLHPVIIVCDNDDGFKDIKKAIKEKCKKDVDKNSTADFYLLSNNLYLVKTPENLKTGVDSSIEDLFPHSVLGTPVGGKPFDRNKKHGDDTSYGKKIFAEQVVLKNSNSIDFSGFELLLKRMEACISSHKAMLMARSA